MGMYNAFGLFGLAFFAHQAGLGQKWVGGILLFAVFNLALEA